MAYDLELDALVRALTAPEALVRKPMFGGTCYLAGGKMVCGVWRDRLILRLGVERAAAALAAGEGQPFDITGKAMKGWIMVPAGIEPAAAAAWIAQALAFVRGL
jgi:hypothetical protein